MGVNMELDYSRVLGGVLLFLLGMGVYHVSTLAGMTPLNPYWFYHMNYNYNLSVSHPHNVNCYHTGSGYICDILVKSDNITLGRVFPTGSMLPIMAGNSTTIQIPINSLDDIHVGDFVCYKIPEHEYPWCHRVIQINRKEKCVYIQGINSPIPDFFKAKPLCVPLSNITGKIIAVVN